MSEMKTVVVYDSDDINQALAILNEQTPVVGIESMRNIVNVFDILKHKGSVQEAAVRRDEEGNASYEEPGMMEEIPPMEEPRYMGEGEVVYDADEVKEVPNETESYDNEEVGEPDRNPSKDFEEESPVETCDCEVVD